MLRRCSHLLHTISASFTSILCVLQLGDDPDAPLPRYPSSERSWREDARDVNTSAATGIANAAKVAMRTPRLFTPRCYPKACPFYSAFYEHSRLLPQVTANVSGKVLSVAVPVGGWALRQGFKAARGALNRNSTKQPSISKRSRRRSADESD